jgi:HAMP domain-containing protein
MRDEPSLDKNRDSKRESRTKTAFIAVVFQIRLAMKVGLVVVLSMSLAALMFYFLTPRQVAGSYLEGFWGLNEVRLALLRITIFSGAAQLALSGLLISGVALFASHKIAGPLIRLARCLRRLAEGNIHQTISFRKGDQDQPLASAFNDLCRRWRQRVSAADEAAAELGDLRENLRMHANAGSFSPEEMDKVAGRIRAQAEKLKSAGTFGVETNAR